MNDDWITGTWTSGGFTLYLPAVAKLKLSDLNRVCDLISMCDKSLANIINDHDRIIEAIRNSDQTEKKKERKIKEIERRKSDYEKVYHWNVD